MKQTTGYVHLYYGDGKGKTSILNGMLLRALGNDWKVKYYRFLKNRFSGENVIFNKLNVNFVNCYNFSKKFFWEMNDEERAKLKVELQVWYQKLFNDVKSGDYDLILIDELLDCVVDKLITNDNIIDLIKNKSKNLELVFSGHQVDEILFSHFDLISKVCKQKHYFETLNVMARKGIEF